jgi:prophage regulatory protein
MEQKILKLPELQERVALKKTAIYGLMSAGLFPRPVQLSLRAVGWRSSEVEAWLESRPRTGGKDARAKVEGVTLRAEAGHVSARGSA